MPQVENKTWKWTEVKLKGHQYICILSVFHTNFLTWSGLRPGGTHVYSSSAHPLSSSLCECLWWCIRASWRARPGGAGCTGLLKGSWWEEPAAPLWKAMAMAIGGPGPRPSPEGPPASVEVRWCSSLGHLQLLHTFLKSESKTLG